jgi:hypothetical protein
MEVELTERCIQYCRIKQDLDERHLIQFSVLGFSIHHVIATLETSETPAIEQLRKKVDGEVVQVSPHVNRLTGGSVFVDLCNQYRYGVDDDWFEIGDGLLGEDMRECFPFRLMFGFDTHIVHIPVLASDAIIPCVFQHICTMAVDVGFRLRS